MDSFENARLFVTKRDGGNWTFTLADGAGFSVIEVIGSFRVWNNLVVLCIVS